ncbi:hypothetical protein Droror1_Dr00020170 [Drosera rotundifolia]
MATSSLPLPVSLNRASYLESKADAPQHETKRQELPNGHRATPGLSGRCQWLIMLLFILLVLVAGHIHGERSRTKEVEGRFC